MFEKNISAKIRYLTKRAFFALLQGDHFELSQKLLIITFKEKIICKAAILHIVDVFSPFDNNTPTSSNAL